MRGFSKAIIMGNLTRDPEMRTTPNGAQVCSFAVAVNRTMNGQEMVSYIDCVAWNKTAEVLGQWLKKGSGIMLSGRLDQRSWEDKNTGQRRSRTEIVVEDFTFVGGRDNNGAGGAGFGGNAGASASRRAASAPAEAGAEQNFGADVVPEDVPEDQINLDDIPF